MLGGDEEVLVGSVAGGGRWVVVVQLVELIFVTNVTNYICGEKIVTWRNFGKFWKILGNFGKF